MTVANIEPQAVALFPDEETAEGRLRRRGIEIIEQATALVIADAAECEIAAAQRNEIRAAIKEAEAFFEPMVTAAHAAHKAATGRREQIVGPLKQALEIHNKKIGAFELEREHERERALRDAEAVAYAEAKREQEARAAALAAAGADEAAARTLAQPVLVAPVALAEVQRSAHVDFRDDWEITIIDANAVPREFCIPDVAAIDAYVKATKGARAVPGVAITKKKIVAKKRSAQSR